MKWPGILKSNLGAISEYPAISFTVISFHHKAFCRRRSRVKNLFWFPYHYVSRAVYTQFTSFYQQLNNLDFESVNHFWKAKVFTIINHPTRSPPYRGRMVCVSQWPLELCRLESCTPGRVTHHPYRTGRGVEARRILQVGDWTGGW